MAIVAAISAIGWSIPAFALEPSDGAGQPTRPGYQHVLERSIGDPDDLVPPPLPIPERSREFYRNLENPVASSRETVAKGRLLYVANCRICHGSADAGPRSNVGLTTPPQDLTSAAYQTTRRDGELFFAIKFGLPETAMLPWGGRLSDREMWLLVDYLRELGRGR